MTDKRTTCPRCGKNDLHPELVMNKCSRRHDVYICGPCGNDEAALDFARQPPLPKGDWARPPEVTVRQGECWDPSEGT